MKTQKWWGYLHQNGTIQIKPWFGDREDYRGDCNANPFVKEVVEPFEAESEVAARLHIVNELSNGRQWKTEIRDDASVLYFGIDENRLEMARAYHGVLQTIAAEHNRQLDQAKGALRQLADAIRMPWVLMRLRGATAGNDIETAQAAARKILRRG